MQLGTNASRQASNMQFDDAWCAKSMQSTLLAILTIVCYMQNLRAQQIKQVSSGP